MPDKKRLRLELPRLAESFVPRVALTALRALGWSSRLRPALRDTLRFIDTDGIKRTHTFTINFRTQDGEHEVWARVESGRVRSGSGTREDADACIECDDDGTLWRFLVQGEAPNLLSWLTEHRAHVTGHASVLAKFVQVAGASHIGVTPLRRLKRWPSDMPDRDKLEIVARRGTSKPFGSPSGVRNLPDPAFTHWSLEDFPRLERKLHRLHGAKPRICCERAVLLTDAAGAALQTEGVPPALARARQLAHVLKNKAAIVREDDVVLGTTTQHELGVPVYPELSHLLLWPELQTLPLRDPVPIAIEPEDFEKLDAHVFPFWIGRNVVDVACSHESDASFLTLLSGARPIHLDQQNGTSCTIPDFQTILSQGLKSLADESRDIQSMVPPGQAAFHEAQTVAIGGVLDYAQRLAERAEIAARDAEDSARRQELMETALSCRRCPAEQAETLLDALNSIRICVAALDVESINDGLSLGRLDVLLQPYLDRELERSKVANRREVLRRCVERVACLLLSLADHMPLHSMATQAMRSGCRSRQAITIGGVLPDGSSAVCDMTYIILKASEMLGLADPRVHVRYDPTTSPDYLLRRACEVALLTGGGPSIHNDPVTINALTAQGIHKPRARDWAVTAALTPTVAGEHLAHPSAVTVDLVAALEMALFDGEHPTIPTLRGPSTGGTEGISTWTGLLDALERQFRALLALAAHGSERLERALENVPCPLLSSLLLGTQESGLDITCGGARYDNPSVVIIGLPDTIDSLCALDELVFKRGVYTLETVLAAMNDDFLGTPTLHEALVGEAPKFGDGSERVLTVTHQVMSMIHAAVREHRGHRSGRWVPAYGGLTANVTFGRAASAIPSGRRAGEPFAPAICPSLAHGALPAQRIRHASSLWSRHFAGGAVFEAVVPGGGLDHVTHVDRLMTHSRTFLHQGGMHLQLATIDAEQLRHADADPATFRDQIVSVCGYDAYFVELPAELRERMVREANLAAESHAPTGHTMPPPPVGEGFEEK